MKMNDKATQPQSWNAQRIFRNNELVQPEEDKAGAGTWGKSQTSQILIFSPKPLRFFWGFLPRSLTHGQISWWLLLHSVCNIAFLFSPKFGLFANPSICFLCSYRLRPWITRKRHVKPALDRLLRSGSTDSNCVAAIIHNESFVRIASPIHYAL